ncbi:MAG: acyl-CoA thioesterase [Ruminococcus sp.]|nr:acyl-CoA thioesterase [Ruminococcus sp.]
MFHPYERAVYYYETDKMGIMHHSNYLRIFEEARVDFLNQAGMPFEEIESRGIAMPVLSASCSYKTPLKFNDVFSVYFIIEKFNGVSMSVLYKVYNKKTGELCAEGTSSHCFTNSELKPIRIKKLHHDIYQIFDDYMKNPIIK